MRSNFIIKSTLGAIFLSILIMASSVKLFGTVSITAPTLNINTGVYPSVYNALGNIVITEGNKKDFKEGTNLTFILTAPANFQFNPGVGAVSFTPSKNITAATIVVTSTTITITYSVVGLNASDDMTISGIQVRSLADNALVPVYSSGTGLITGVTHGTSVFANLSSTFACTPPTTQANSFLASAITTTTMTISWVRGNGNSVLVVARPGTAPADPGNGTTYTGNAAYGSGSACGGGFVVYNGTGTSVNLSNLTPATTYYFAIYEFATTGPCYLLTELAGNAATGSCAPSVQASTFSAPTITMNSITVNWTRGNGNRVMVVAKSGSAPTDPTTGTSYTANALYGSGSACGGGFVVYDGTGTSVNVTGLTATTTYYFAIYEYNTAGLCYNLTELSGNATTQSASGTAIIGTGTSTTTYPYRGYYEDARCQIIYLASEIAAAGITPGSTINTLAWNVATKSSSQPFTGFTVKIAHTSASSFASAAWLTPAWTAVYSNNYTTTTGWQSYTIGGGFVWDGSSNIVIEACFNNTSYTADDPTYYTTTTGNTVCYNYMDDETGCTMAASYTSASRPNVRFTYTLGPNCTGTPLGGTASAAPASICVGASVTLSLSGHSVATGITYQWRSGPTGTGPWTDIVGATTSLYTFSPSSTAWYQCYVLCTSSGNSAVSSAVQVTVTGPTYRTLPYIESFDANWINRCDTREIPLAFWVNSPKTGNMSWRRDDDGAAAVWTSPTSYMYTPAASNGTRSARFHSGYTSAGVIGCLDLYLDLSTVAGTKFLQFDYINTSGTDHMEVLLSTDGGLTFPTTLNSLTLASSWITYTADIASNSPTCVLRFRATADYGSTDIGLDYIRVSNPCSGTPTAGTASIAQTTFCNSGSAQLSLSGYTIAGGITLQWQSSDIGAPYAWSDISGATTPTCVAPTVSQTYYYRCVVKCGSNAAYSNILTFTKTAQSITGTNTPVNIVCNNTAQLTATATGGSINWYAAATGGLPVGSGSPWTTPSLSQNTTYYCVASSGSTSESGGMPAKGNTYGYMYTGYGIVFNATQAFTLLNCTVYPIDDGNITIQLQNNTGAVLWTSPSTAVNGGPNGNAEVITINQAIPVGTGYRLVLSAYSGANLTDLIYDYTTAYPYPSPSGALVVTSGRTTSGTSSTNYYFYNLNITIPCESSPRTPVDVIITGGLSAPVCSTTPVPANNATGVCPVGASISWAPSNTPCRAATSYKLSYGTNTNGDNIMNAVNIGNVTSYSFPANLAGNTTYYWFVTPTNSAGDAVGCGGTPWRFTTAATPALACAGLLGAGVVNVAALPYTQNNSTTCGAGDDLTSANTVTCGSTSYLTGEDKVFVFTPTASGNITITLTSAGSYTGLMLYEGCPLAAGGCGASPGACVGIAQSSTGDKVLNACVVSGVTYYLILDSWASPTCNAYSKIQISAPTGVLVPANDQPCNATPLTLGVPQNGDNSCAGSTNEPATVPSCWSSGVRNTVWFAVTAPASGQISVRTTTSTLTDTQIALFGGPCSNMTQVTGACNENMSGCGSTYASLMTVTGLTPGATYYIVVDGTYDLTGTFTVEAIDPVTQTFPLIPGQDCDIPLPTCNTVITVGDPGFANTGNICDFTGVGNCTGGERASVWYTINIQAAGTLMFTIVPNDWSNGTPVGDETDYDFLVWKTAGTAPITTCAGIMANSATGLVSCNYSYIGITGLYTGGNAPPTYGSSYDAAWEAPLTVAAGDQYLICISNYTQSTSGFVIDYTGSTPGIINVSAVPSLVAWTGVTSQAWGLVNNWGGCGLPSCSTSVVIPSSVNNMPIINANASVNDLTINAGATLTINAGITLEICGNFVNNGTLIASPTSIIKFISPTNLQLVSGSFTGTNKMGHVTVDKAGGSVTFNTNVHIAGNLLINTLTSNLIWPAGIITTLDGNYTNNGLLTANQTSTLQFTHASNIHTLTGFLSGTSKFGNLTVNKAGGNVLVAATATQIEIGGNFTTSSATSIFNTNGKIVIVGGNFSNNNANTTYSNIGTGTLICNGTAAQSYTNTTGVLTLNNVTMNHTGSGVTINNNMVLGTSGTLTLTNGIIITGANMVIVNNTATTACTPGNTSSYVQGNLRRFIPNATGSYDFPVGHAAKGYQRANYNFTTASTVGHLTAFFTPYSVVPGPLGLTECGMTYDHDAIDNGYWTVTANANPNSGKYTCTLYNLNYTNSAGANGYTVMSDHTPAGAGPWQLLNGDGTNGTCVASVVTAVIRQNMCGFSKFGTAASTMGPLPISLLSFTGKQLGNSNILEWVTATEINNDFFVLEKSGDGVNFYELAIEDGAGTSLSPLSYDHVDYAPFSPVSYYKLKQVDFNGDFTYSDIISLANGSSLESSEIINLYPNPTTGALNLEIYSPVDGYVYIEVVDIYGRLIISSNNTVSKGNDVLAFDMQNLATGAYFIKVNFITTGNASFKRFVKQ